MEIERRTISQILKHFEFVTGEFIYVKGTSIRIYYNVRDSGNGFDFLALDLMGYYNEENPWEDLDQTECQVFVHGVAYFDGIRHLYFGSDFTDNNGYFYYAHTYEIIDVMRELRILEEKYCPQL